MQWCYLIHLVQPLGSERKMAQHYIGTAIDVVARLTQHRAGRGARMLAVAAERGIGFDVVRLWPGDRTIERQLKQRGHAPEMCPACAGAAAFRRGRVVSADQLVLDLFPEELPEAPAGIRADWLEYAIQREWRQARPAPARIDLAIVDSCL